MSILSDRIGQFVTIPNTVFRLWPQLGMNAFALFVCLRYHSDEHDVSFPSYTCITEETGLSRRAIAQGIRTLEENGLLERRRRFSSSTVYTLKIPSISSNLQLMPVVANRDRISSNLHPSLVPERATNQTHLTRLNELDSVNDDDSVSMFRQLSTAFVNASRIPELTGGAPKWVENCNKLVAAGVEPVDIEKAIGELRAKEYNIVSIGSIVNAAINCMGKRKGRKESMPVATEEW